MHSCERCDRPLLSDACPFCTKPGPTSAASKLVRLAGAVVTPFVLGACYGAPPCDFYDNDQDGFDDCNVDCDNTDPNVNPDAEEICDDGIDNNCDGIEAVTGGVEVCGNEDDDDCDGEVDEAPDSPGIEIDCFNGLDDDCDGLTDIDDPDCVDRGTIVVQYSFEGAADCAEAGLEELTFTVSNGTGTHAMPISCGYEPYFSTAAGDLTVEVSGQSTDGTRSWTSGPVPVTTIAFESTNQALTLTCTGCP